MMAIPFILFRDVQLLERFQLIRCANISITNGTSIASYSPYKSMKTTEFSKILLPFSLDIALHHVLFVRELTLLLIPLEHVTNPPRLH
jgi:hypothetical protein